MIQYDSKSWLASLFTLRGLYLKRIFWSLLVIVLLTTLICLLDFTFNVIDIRLPLSEHSLMGVVLGLLLVFRTNTAYDRWWEGRKLLGAMTNTSRNVALKFDAFTDKNETALRARLSSLLSAFVLAVPGHLRAGVNLRDISFLDDATLKEISSTAHKPSAIVGLILREVAAMHNAGRITGEKLILIVNNLNELIDEIGGMERIKNTPVPLPYALLLKRFVFAYIITLPFALIGDLGWASIPAVGFIFYVMVGIEVIGEEIENPFGTDENDLPVDEIAMNISRNVKEILTFTHGLSVAPLLEGDSINTPDAAQTAG